MVQLTNTHLTTLLTTLVTTATCLTGTGPKRPSAKPARLSLDEFPWTNPFASSRSETKEFAPACEVEKTFKVSEFLLDDLQERPPRGVRPYGDALKTVFSGRAYPGSWDGIDPHGYDRTFLQMEYSDVPLKVREWIEDQERESKDGKGLFAVFEKPGEDESATSTVVPPRLEDARKVRDLDGKKVVLFAPGAVYRILPLWVAEESGCKDSLLDLNKYSTAVSDGAVISWVTKHPKAKRAKGERETEFTVAAQVLKATDAGFAKPSAKEQGEQKKDEL